MDVGRVGQLVGSADDSPVKVERRRNRLRCRQVIDQLGRNPVVLQVLGDETCVLLIDRLTLARGLGSRECRSEYEREEKGPANSTDV